MDWAWAKATVMGLASEKAPGSATDLPPEPQAGLWDYPSARKLRRSPTAQSTEAEQKPLPAAVSALITTW